MMTPSRRFFVLGVMAVTGAGCGDEGNEVANGGGTAATPAAGGAGRSGDGGGGSGTAGSKATSGGSAGAGTGGQPASGGQGGSGGIGGSTAGSAGEAGSGGSNAPGGSGGAAAGLGGEAAQGGLAGGAGLGAGAGNGGSRTSGAGGSAAGAGGSGGGNPGTCTPSKAAGGKASGSGPHAVVIETNSDPGIEEGTIFRPANLGGDEKYPIFVWGQGACSRNGLANQSAMVEIASHGYFVIADGTPGGSENRVMDRSQLEAMAAPLIAYIDWAIAENEKPCSAYYQALDTTMISANGFSCGGLMAQGTVTDPRVVTWGVTSSGMAGADQAFYDLIDTPVLFVEGGPEDVAYDGAVQGYEAIRELGVPVLWFSANRGHGGDLFEPDGGDFTKINLAWLNWWLKGDETATGKGLLVGPTCPYCDDSAWEVWSANVP